jgi:hypothetical protein
LVAQLTHSGIASGTIGNANIKIYVLITYILAKHILIWYYIFTMDIPAVKDDVICVDLNYSGDNGNSE